MYTHNYTENMRSESTARRSYGWKHSLEKPTVPMCSGCSAQTPGGNFWIRREPNKRLPGSHNHLRTRSRHWIIRLLFAPSQRLSVLPVTLLAEALLFERNEVEFMMYNLPRTRAA